jgi:DNA-binding CsgD family transcriptional regulator
MLSSPVLFSAFAGRESEWDHLAARRREASASRGGLVLVAGEAGMGKSRLIGEFFARGTAGCATARAACRDFAQSPLAPLDDALASLTVEPDPRGPTASNSGGSAAGANRGGSAGASHIGGSAAGAIEERVAQIRSAFSARAARRTTVVAIEDVHWADPELLHTLRLLANDAASQRILYIVSYRDDEVNATHPNFIALGRLMRDPATSRIVLGGLEPETMRRLLREATHDAANVAEILEDVTARADGNPLFAEELLRHALDAAPGGAFSGVPISLHTLVRERVLRCTPNESRLLATAAVFGRTFDSRLVATISGVPARDPAADLRRLCDMQLIAPVDGKPQHFAFRHALTRDAIYSEVFPADVGPIHRRIADALEAKDRDAFALEIAYHYWQSGERFAAAAFARAAGLARATYAYGEAIRWYERAADAEREPGAVARALIELGKVLTMIGDVARAIDAFGRAATSALSVNDVGLAVRARKLTAGILANDGRRSEAIALLDATLALPAPDDDAVRLGLTLRIISYTLMGQELGDARRRLHELDITTLGADDPLLAEYASLFAIVHAREGDLAGWRADNDRALSVYRRRGAAMFERYQRAIFAMQAAAVGDLALAYEQLGKALAASTESASSRNDVPAGMALVEFDRGNIRSARAWLERIEPSTQIETRKLRSLAGVQIADALADAELLDRHLDMTLLDEVRGCDDVYGFVQLSCAFAGALANAGDSQAANQLIESALPAIASTYRFCSALATAARVRPDLVSPFAALFEARAGDPFHAAMLALLDAECGRSSGAATNAASRGIAAHDGFLALGWPLFAARGAELGERPDLAFKLYRTAGHTRGMQRTANHEAAAAPWDPLSPRERELAILVGNGKKNREAAAAMRVSEKTVEKHLSSIYEKLALSSRTQLAAYVARASARSDPPP